MERSITSNIIKKKDENNGSKNNDDFCTKRQKLSHDGSGSNEYTTNTEELQSIILSSKRYNKNNIQYYHPMKFVTWNCNGFLVRARYNQQEIQSLVDTTQNPDVICIQEARLKAAKEGSRMIRGKPLREKDDYKHVQTLFEETFDNYTPFWSLANTKYAGTLTLVKNTVLSKSGSSKERNTTNNGTYDSNLVAFSPKSAIDLLLRRFRKTREECGLDKDTNEYVHQHNNQQKQQQTSLRSFFAPKKSSNTNDISKNRNHYQDHTEEGRFQFFCFPGMDLVQTYVPNNGTKEESFQRRREWDASMIQFIKERKQILQSISALNNNYEEESKNQNNNKEMKIDPSIERKLLWCGDMNVAATYKDGSHWERRVSKQHQKDGADDDIYEWFRDESKCLSGKKKKERKLPENIGIPGFTPAERRRFATFLKEGDFCDVWRNIHPDGVTTTDVATTGSVWERPNYTWRGTPARYFGDYALYEGKAQRIDYFLLSPSKLMLDSNEKEVQKCKIRGYGSRREGLFCGSDHCAVELVLNSPTNIP